MRVTDNLYRYMTYSYLVLARLINILNSHLNTTKYMMNQNLFCYALVLAIIIERKEDVSLKNMYYLFCSNNNIQIDVNRCIKSYPKEKLKTCTDKLTYCFAGGLFIIM